MLSPKQIVADAIAKGYLSHPTAFVAPAAVLAPKRPILLPCEAGIAKAKPLPKRKRMYAVRPAKPKRYVIHLKDRPDLRDSLTDGV